MLLKYFYNDELAHASYMVGCQATGEAIVIDPGRDIAPYRQAAADNRLRIVAATETHIHADFLSGARELAVQTGAKLYLSDEGDADWKYGYLTEHNHQLLHDGDSFKIGNIKFEVHHTPGHTPEHISLMLTDTAGADRPMGVFTGDFVFVGDVGRPDLLEEAAGMVGTADSGARQMFHSLAKFREWPDHLQVWPAHGAGSACGKALGAIPSSTVGYEKMFNWALQHDDEDEFVSALLAGQPEAPKYFAVMKKLNKEGPAILNGLPSPMRVYESRLQDLLDDGHPVVDTRPADHFAQHHIPGTINIPFDGSFANWCGWLLDYDKPYYLIIDPARVPDAVRILIYIGLDNLDGYFVPAIIDDWPELQGYGSEPPEALAERIIRGELALLDVRSQSEWDEGHVPQAHHIMLGKLPNRLEELSGDEPVVVQCLSGARSAIGASILQANGLTDVINMTGGYRDWVSAGLPVERGNGA